MKRTRRGFTLIEVLGTITLLGAVWATVVLALHAMYEAERRLSRGFETANTVDHLAQRLRSDAHAARSVSLDDAGDDSVLLLLSSPARRIRYRGVEQGVERTVLVSDAVEHREVFYLSAAAVGWTLEARDQGEVILLRLQLPDPRRQLAREYEVKAAVGFAAVNAAEVEVEQP
jgi:type II secretory pathway pseudopilin PulG